MNLDDDDTVDELPVQPRKNISAEDLKLLQRAARAMGVERFEEVEGEGYANLYFSDGSTAHSWNPLQFDGDALELAVRLGITIRPMPQAGSVWAQKDERKPTTCRDEVNIMNAARYAIVLAAADIGKAL